MANKNGLTLTYNMYYNRIKLPLMVLASLLFGTFINAQESVNASGGEATGTGGTVSYSVGQTVYVTHSTSNGSIAEGVQHAYEIFTVGVKEVTLDLSLKVFPNPTTDNLTLKVNEYNNEQLSFQLYDLQGKLVATGEVNSEETQINTASLPNATYFIHVVDKDNKKAASFKVVKN